MLAGKRIAMPVQIKPKVYFVIVATASQVLDKEETQDKQGWQQSLVQ